MEKEKKINISSKVILLIAVICCVLAYFFIPSVNRILNKIFVMFASGDFTEVKQFISSEYMRQLFHLRLWFFNQ